MLKNLPIIILGVVLVGIIGVSCYTNPPDQQQNASASNGAPVSAIAPAQPNEAGQNGRTASHSPSWRNLFLWPSGVEALAVSATLFFIAWQALLTRQAIVSADAASQIELRAYIVVNIASGTMQDREQGLKFEGSPLVSNSGKTPAHNLRWRTNSSALKDEEAGTYSFPPGESEVGGEVLGVGQTMRLGVVYRDYYDAVDAEDIKLGENGRGFYYWGVVSYDDAFGAPHTTQFCHRIYFYPDIDRAGKWKVGGRYVAGKNKAT